MEYKDIAKRIKARRQELDLSQEEVGRYLGISQNAYKRYDNGTLRKIPPRDTMEKLAQILKTTPEKLLGVQDIFLENFPIEMQDWMLKNPEAKHWMFDAYKRYLDSKLEERMR